MIRHLPTIVLSAFLLLLVVTSPLDSSYLGAQILSDDPLPYTLEVLDPEIKSFNLGNPHSFDIPVKVLTMQSEYCCFSAFIRFLLEGEETHFQDRPLHTCSRCSNDSEFVTWTIPSETITDRIEQTNLRQSGSQITAFEIHDRRELTIRPSDGPLSLGLLEDVESPRTASELVVFSTNPKVKVWVSPEDEIFACSDRDENDECDVSGGAMTVESTDPLVPLLQANADFRLVDGKKYVRVRRTQTGDQACQAVGSSVSMNGKCLGSSSGYDLQNSGGVCKAFHPTASDFSSPEDLLSAEENAYGANSSGYCGDGGSITCDAFGAARSSTQSQPLDDTCQICPTCQPALCSTTPASLGLDEIYTECEFSNPNVCRTDLVTAGFTLRNERIVTKAGTQDGGTNGAPVGVDLLELIREDPEPGEETPEKITVKRMTIQQLACPTNILFFLDGEQVHSADKPCNSTTVTMPSAGVVADRMLIPPNNGLTIEYERNILIPLEQSQPTSISNSVGVKDLGEVKSLFEPVLSTPTDVVRFTDSFSIQIDSANLVAWFAPASFTGITPLTTTTSTKMNDHLFICKDSDQDGRCDITQCEAPTETIAPTLRTVQISSGSTPTITTTPLLSDDETIQLATNCSTCQIQSVPAASSVRPGVPTMLQVSLIDSTSGRISTTLLVVGQSQRITDLYDKDRQKYPTGLIPSVFLGESNDYHHLLSSGTGAAELISLNIKPLKNQQGKNILNGESSPTLFSAEREGVFYLLVRDSRIWDLSTLNDSKFTPSPLHGFFTGLSENTSPASCSTSLQSLLPQANFLLNINTFQTFLDLLTLCQRP